MKKELPDKSIFENPELYRLLFENSMDAILLTSPDGSIYKANPAACRIFNLSEKELIKRGRDRIIDLSDPRLKKALTERTKKNKFFGELTFLRKGGEKFTGEISTSIFKDANGNLRTSMIIRDITDRKIANQKLIKTNRIYAVISQINQLIVHEKNRDKLLDKVCKIAIEYGRFRMAWVGLIDNMNLKIKPCAWAGDDRGYLSKMKKNIAENDEPAAKVLIHKKYLVYNKIINVKGKSWQNKALRRGFKSAAFFPIKLKNKIIGVFCLFSSETDFFDNQEIKLLKETTSDISFALEVLEGDEERKQFEENLQEKEHMLSESQHIAHIGGWSWDLSGPIKWTDETYRIYGVSAKNFIPTVKSLIGLLHPDDRLLMQNWIEACAADRKPGELEFRSLLPDGSTRILAGRGEMKYDKKNKKKFMAGTVQDITVRKRNAEALKEKEKLFSIIYKNSPIAMSMLRVSDGKIIDVNDQWCRLTGFSKEEMIGYKLEKLKIFNYKKKNKLIQDLIKSANSSHTESWINTKSGKKRNIIRSSEQIAVNDKHIIILNVIDNTDRKRIQEELKKNEHFISAIAETSPILLYVYDVESNKNVYTNAGIERLLGYSAKQVESIGKNLLLSLTHPNDRQKVIDFQSEIFNASDNDILEIEYRMKHKNGNWIDLHTIERVFLRNPDGSVKQKIGVATNITETKHNEVALRNSEERLLKAESIAHMGFLNWDLKTNEIFLSNEAYRIHGLEIRENMSEPDLVNKAVHPDDREFVGKELQLAVQGVKDYNIDHRILLPDGTVRWVHAQAEITKDSMGIPDKLLGTVIDITERKLAEEALRVSEEKFKLAFKTNPDSININRLSDGVYIDVNEGFTRITGYTAGEVIGKTSLELNIWENPDDRKRLIEGLKTSKRVDNLEAKFRFKNGKIGYGLMSASIISLNNVPHILSITKDITDWITIEEALHQSEVRFESVIKNAAEGITITNESGKVIIWNNALKHITGFNENQTIGKNIWDVELLLEPKEFRTDEKRTEYKNNIKEILTSGNSSYFEKPAEREFSRANGKALFLKKTLNPVKTEKGYILVITIEDITERKKAEKALSESEKRYRQLLEVAPVGIAVHQDGKVVYCNPESMNILGAKSKDEIIGKRIEGMIHPDRLQESLSRITKILAGNKSLYPVDNVFMKLDGTPVDVEVMAAPIIYKEKPALQVIMLDITERKRVEGQLQKLMNRLIESEELMRKSAAQQLHDQVGQNLTALTINLSYIQTQLSGDSKIKIEKRLKDSLSVLNDTIEQTRDIMIELQPPVLEDYGLGSAIIWSLNKFEERTKIKTNYIGKDFVNRLPYSQEAALFRVFQEILHNIAKHSRAKKVAVRLIEINDTIKLTVEDDGIGFDAYKIMNKKNRKSFGLVSMTERINFIGGIIHINSEPEKGTIVEIELRR